MTIIMLPIFLELYDYYLIKLWYASDFFFCFVKFLSQANVHSYTVIVVTILQVSLVFSNCCITRCLHGWRNSGPPARVRTPLSSPPSLSFSVCLSVCLSFSLPTSLPPSLPPSLSPSLPHSLPPSLLPLLSPLFFADYYCIIIFILCILYRPTIIVLDSMLVRRRSVMTLRRWVLVILFLLRSHCMYYYW